MEERAQEHKSKQHKRGDIIFTSNQLPYTIHPRTSSHAKAYRSTSRLFLCPPSSDSHVTMCKQSLLSFHHHSLCFYTCIVHSRLLFLALESTRVESLLVDLGKDAGRLLAFGRRVELEERGHLLVISEQ